MIGNMLFNFPLRLDFPQHILRIFCVDSLLFFFLIWPVCLRGLRMRICCQMGRAALCGIWSTSIDKVERASTNNRCVWFEAHFFIGIQYMLVGLCWRFLRIEKIVCSAHTRAPLTDLSSFAVALQKKMYYFCHWMIAFVFHSYIPHDR